MLRADSRQFDRVFCRGLRKWGKPAVEVEQAVLDEGERVANELRRFLRVINGVSTVCPLLGLLGTVSGMMESFDVIANSSAMGRTELLAGGIGSALLSTAAGLSVAIPALIFYLYFVGRVDSLVMEIDRRGQEIVHLISAEASQRRTEEKGGIETRSSQRRRMRPPTTIHGSGLPPNVVARTNAAKDTTRSDSVELHAHD